MKTKWEDITKDHTARYLWAMKTIARKYNQRRGLNILDVACGVGYGSYMLANKYGHAVHAIDRNDDATEFQQKYWRHPFVLFEQADVFEANYKNAYHAVISFETIEHIVDDLGFVKKLCELAPIVIVSVPNQDRIPFRPEKHHHHQRHYTKDELDAIFPVGKRTWCEQYNKTSQSAMVPLGTNKKRIGRTLGLVWEKND